MKYQFEHDKIEYCIECPCHIFVEDPVGGMCWPDECGMNVKLTYGEYKVPSDCPLIEVTP